MKEITVAGLHSHKNIGEHILFKTTIWLVNSLTDANIRCVDFQASPGGVRPLYARCTRKLKHLFLQILGNGKTAVESTHAQLHRYRMVHRNQFLREIRGSDALIFACGSFKYGTQLLWCSYFTIIECCEILGVPVMFNGVNVQAYCADSYACRKLRECANNSAVKVFVTRDGQAGIDRLRKDYIVNPEICLLDAGDPGFWIPEAYDAKKKPGGNIIGVNLMRSTQFRRYGIEIAPEQVEKAYSELLQLLDEAGMKWELFTNGMPEDLDGLDHIRETYKGSGDLKAFVPIDDRDFIHHICEYRAVVGARLHACISAYALDIPMVGYIWDEKMERFAQVTNNVERMCTPERFSGKRLFDMLNSTIDKPYDTARRQKLKNQSREAILHFLTMAGVADQTDRKENA